MSKCIRCGKTFDKHEKKYCYQCTCALENEILGRIRSRMHRKAKLHVDGGMYVELRDVNEVLDESRKGVNK